MRLNRFRFTIRTMMIAVLIAVIISAIGVFMPRPLTLFLGERGIGLTGGRYVAVIATLTVVDSLPFAIAVVLAVSATAKKQTRRGKVVHGLLAVGVLALGLAIAHSPLDGLRWANQLKDGNYLCHYQQYRLWPGNQVTPCIETITATGKARSWTLRSYPICKDTFLQGMPDWRTNADQSVAWLIDRPNSRLKYGVVWCSLNRLTGGIRRLGRQASRRCQRDQRRPAVAMRSSRSKQTRHVKPFAVDLHFHSRRDDRGLLQPGNDLRRLQVAFLRQQRGRGGRDDRGGEARAVFLRVAYRPDSRDLLLREKVAGTAG